MSREVPAKTLDVNSQCMLQNRLLREGKNTLFDLWFILGATDKTVGFNKLGNCPE